MTRQKATLRAARPDGVAQPPPGVSNGPDDGVGEESTGVIPGNTAGWEAHGAVMGGGWVARDSSAAASGEYGSDNGQHGSDDGHWGYVV